MSDAAQQRFNEYFGPEFGHGKPFDLDAVRTALGYFGAVLDELPPVFHVAGTNGKGSTIAFMRAIAEAAELKVHAFTKPHLHALRERFLVAGATIDDDALNFWAYEIFSRAPELTQFDAQVIAALMLFSTYHADVVLLETGMGGRDDSTNVLPHAAASIITPIGLDHQNALGPTLSDIAAHKAGILRARTPAIIARQPPEAMAVIEAEAARVGAPLFRAGVEWDAYASKGRLVVQTETRALDLPLPALAGPHQIDNAGLACAAFLCTSLFDIPDDAFARGTTNARWPGRLQPLTRGALAAPVLAQGGEVWVDGGHNAHAAQALVRWLTDMQRKRKAETIAIVGMRARKDSDAFIAAIAGHVDHFIFLPLAEDHVAPAEMIVQARAHGADASSAPSLTAAMQNAAQFPAPRVLICGSLLLAAEALRA